MQKAISKHWPVFVLPTLIAFIIGFIWPFIWGIYLSFQRFTTVSKTTFVGIQNYISVFQDSTFTICTFLTLTNSFKLFDQNVALTAGEPANASEMLALNIYNTFYGRSGAQWKGIGQAKAVIFFLIVVVISMIQLHFTRSKEVQQ